MINELTILFAIIGLIGIEIAKNGGKAISLEEAGEIIETSKKTYKSFKKEMKSKELSDPGIPIDEKCTFTGPEKRSKTERRKLINRRHEIYPKV